jgi:hypothetical protein
MPNEYKLNVREGSATNCPAILETYAVSETGFIIPFTWLASDKFRLSKTDSDQHFTPLIQPPAVNLQTFMEASWVKP